MEILFRNLITTTTMMSVASNSDILENVFNPDKFLQYFTDGYADDATTTSIVIDFGATQTVSRIAMLEHNLESFRFFYDGLTANTFALSGPTTTADINSNTATDTYLQISSEIQCRTVTLDMRKTISANAEKAIGFLHISSVNLDFSRVPNASGYIPSLEPKQIVHTLSDGGTRVHTVRQKWKTKIKLAYVDSTVRDGLRQIYDEQAAFVYVPFGTGTAWDGILFEAVWVGPFDFYRYSDDAATAGFSGTMEFRETAT